MIPGFGASLCCTCHSSSLQGHSPALSNPTHLSWSSIVYALATRAIHLEYHSQASPPARLPRTRQLDPLLSATEKTRKRSPADAPAAATEKYSRPRSSTSARRILFPGYRRPRSNRSSVPWSLRFTQHQHISPSVSRDNIRSHEHRMSYTWPTA